jgi:succinate dehydrogenase / fumarate reductase flavoprotein subunit
VRDAFRRATEPLHRAGGANPYLLHEKLQDVMGSCVGIVRNEQDLETGIAELEKLREEAATVKAHGASQFNPGWDAALSFRSLLVVSEAVARAALVRKESRGAHTRVDHEGERAEGLGYNVVVRRGADGRMAVEKVPRAEPPAELAEIAHASIEDLEAGRVGAGERARV